MNKVAHEPVLRSTLLGCLLHLERTTTAALSGIAPDAWSWGNQPLIALGRRSYEVYLTHMFVVFTLFGLYKSVGLPLGAVPVLFIGVILISSLLGELVARFYSEPMNRLIRRRLGEGPERLGSVL